MLPNTFERVPHHTPSSSNRAIQRGIDASVRYHAARPEHIDRRLTELDREWDIERCLETMAPTITLLGLTLGVTRNRRWLFLPAFVQTFFLQHSTACRIQFGHDAAVLDHPQNAFVEQWR